jgi:hypothetical protein
MMVDKELSGSDLRLCKRGCLRGGPRRAAALIWNTSMREAPESVFLNIFIETFHDEIDSS